MAEVSPPRPHDLLRISSARDLSVDAPPWVGAALNVAPWVVVRRAASSDGRVAVGVRGTTRSERHATELDLADVREVIAPEDLSNVAAETGRHLPVLSALRVVGPILDETGIPWGPTGSVGFELATGIPTAAPTSDLDLVVRPDATATLLPVLARLSRAFGYLSVRVDCQVETGSGAVALGELVSGRTDVLVRTVDGPRLVSRSVAVS